MATVNVNGSYAAVEGDDTLVITNSQWVHLDYGVNVGAQGVIANLTNTSLYDGVTPLTPLNEVDATNASILASPWTIIDQFGTIDTLQGFVAGGIWGTPYDDIVVADAIFDFNPNGGNDQLYIAGDAYASLSAPYGARMVIFNISENNYTYFYPDGSQGSVSVSGPGTLTALVGAAPNGNGQVINSLTGSTGNDRFASLGATDLIWTAGGADEIAIWEPGGEVSIQDEFSSDDFFSFIVDGRFGFDTNDWLSNFEVTYNGFDRTVIRTTSANVPVTDLVVLGEYSLDSLFIDESIPGQVRLYLNPDVPQITLDAYSSPKYDEYSFKYFQTDFNNAGLNFDTTNMLVTSSTGFQYDLSDYLTNGRFLALGLTTGDDIITKDQSVYLDVFYFGGHDVINSSVHSIDTSVSVDGNGIARWAGYQNGESLYFSGGPGYTGNATVNIDANNNLNINIFDDTGTTGTITGKNIERINISGIGDHTVVGNDFEHMFRFNSTGTDVLTAGGGRDFISIGTNAVDITFTDYEEGEWISLDRGWGFDPTQFASQLQARVVDQADGKYTYFSVINAGAGDKVDFLKVAGEFSVDQIHLGYRGSEPYSDGNDLFFTLKENSTFTPQVSLNAYNVQNYDLYDFASSFSVNSPDNNIYFDSATMQVLSSDGLQYDLSEYQTNGRFLAIRGTIGDDVFKTDSSLAFFDVEYTGGNDVYLSDVHDINTNVVVDSSGVARWSSIGGSNIDSLQFLGASYVANKMVNIDASNTLKIEIFDNTGTLGSITGKNIERLNFIGTGNHTVVGNDFEHMFRFNSTGTDVLTAGGGRDFISIGTNAVDITFTDYEEGEWISLDRGWGFDPTQFASQLQARVVDQADGKYTYFSVINAGAGDKVDFLKVAGEFSVDQIHLGYRGSEPYSDGNDLFFTLTSVLPEVTGTDGRDTLVGGRDAEIIFGEAGGDTILGRGGNDELYGGSGRDTLRGGSGDDILNGGDGHDTLYGGSGSDFLFGGDGRDELKGNKGADTLEGGLGKDLLYAGVDSDMDTFVFRQIEDSAKGRNSDEIFQFDSGEDKIDLQFIDANTLLVGDQSFEFSEGRAAHSIWVKESDRDLLVRGDVDGDARHDFEIVLNNLSDITEYDFIL